MSISSPRRSRYRRTFLNLSLRSSWKGQWKLYRYLPVGLNSIPNSTDAYYIIYTMNTIWGHQLHRVISLSRVPGIPHVHQKHKAVKVFPVCADNNVKMTDKHLTSSLRRVTLDQRCPFHIGHPLHPTCNNHSASVGSKLVIFDQGGP